MKKLLFIILLLCASCVGQQHFTANVKKKPLTQQRGLFEKKPMSQQLKYAKPSAKSCRRYNP